jgi:hypothetical protein
MIILCILYLSIFYLALMYSNVQLSIYYVKNTMLVIKQKQKHNQLYNYKNK